MGKQERIEQRWYQRPAVAGLIGLAVLLAVLVFPNLASAAPLATCGWTGSLNASWHTGANWSCGQVPGSLDDVVIYGTSRDPIISAGAQAGSVTIEPGAALAFSGSPTLEVYGDWMNSGTLNPGTGTVSFVGGGNLAVVQASLDYALDPQNFGLDDLDAFPPAGWSVENNVGTCGWASTATTLNSNLVTADGNAADADPISCGGPINTELYTPEFDLSAAVSPVLSFASDFFPIDPGDLATVEISVDAGHNVWTEVYSYMAADGDVNELVSLSLNPYAGEPTVMVRFGFVTTDELGGEWQIDDVQVSDPSGVGGAHEFYNLTVGANTTAALGGALTLGRLSTGGGVLDMTADGSLLTTEGPVTNYGTLRWRQNVTGATEFRVTNAAGTAVTYYGVLVTPVAALGQTTVEILGHQDALGCTKAAGEDHLLRRCFDIVPAVIPPAGQGATIRFWFEASEVPAGQNPTALKLWHYGASWVQVGSNYASSPSCLPGEVCWFQADGIETFSPFGLGSTSAPTAVSLREFTASAGGRPSAILVLLGLAVALTGLLLRRQRENR